MYDVYLAGAMSGRKLEDVLIERSIAKALLDKVGLTYYDPAADEDLNTVSTDGSINKSFDKKRMEWYVKKDLKAVSSSQCVLNLTGDIMSDGCAWEMAFAVYHRQIPVYLIAPQRILGIKMGFTNILVDGMFTTIEEAIQFLISKKVSEQV